MTIAQQDDAATQINEILSTFAHEFRTPLAVVQTSLHLARTYLGQGDAQRAEIKMDMIEKEVQQLKTLLEHLTSHRIFWQDELVPCCQPIALYDYCSALLDEISLSTPTINHTFQLEIADDLTSVVLDPYLLRHALLNLLTNATKFSPVGSCVTLRVCCRPQAVVFEVEDEGMGIPAQEQSRLFEPFFRASNANDTPGSGLGLAFVKRCVDAMQGRIVVHSAESIGTRIAMIFVQ